MHGGSIRDIDDADIPFLQLADGGEDHGEFMLGGIGVTQADDILSAVIENDVVGVGKVDFGNVWPFFLETRAISRI